jgi:hypothetical protein
MSTRLIILQEIERGDGKRGRREGGRDGVSRCRLGRRRRKTERDGRERETWTHTHTGPVAGRKGGTVVGESQGADIGPLCEVQCFYCLSCVREHILVREHVLAREHIGPLC